MSSLIFGYLRKRQEKLNNKSKIVGMTGGSPDSTYSENDNNNVFMSVATTEAGGGYFDPPIENFRPQKDNNKVGPQVIEQFQLLRKLPRNSK